VGGGGEVGVGFKNTSSIGGPGSQRVQLPLVGHWRDFSRWGRAKVKAPKQCCLTMLCQRSIGISYLAHQL